MKTVHHIGWTVADIERSMVFYEQIMGFPCRTRQRVCGAYLADITGYPDVIMEQAFLELPGGTILELLQYIQPQAPSRSAETYIPGAGHTCLEVEDIWASYRRLQAMNVQFRSPPVTITAGRNKGGFGVYLRDPDGITWELFQKPNPAVHVR